MKKLHLLTKRANGIDLNGLSFNKQDKTYTSGSWDFSVDDAKKIVGGSIYLHETKSEASVFGGTVVGFVNVVLADNDKAAKKKRIDFIFRAELGATGIPWGGRGYAMEWTSEVIE